MKTAVVRKKFLSIVAGSFIFFPAGPVFADLTDIEAAILGRNYTQAQALAQEALAAHPKNSTAQKAQYYLGLSQLGQAKYSQALESFEVLRRERMDSSLRERVYLGIFDAYYLQEQYSEAQATLREFLEDTKPEAMSLFYLKLAKANLKLAHWDEATDYLTKIIRSFPNSLEVPAARQLLGEKHYFAVQVGAFTERQLAEALVDELKQKNEYAYIVESVDPQKDRKYYRVRVGQLAFLREAQTLKTRLAKLGYPTQIYP